jgi:hypothetical protein
MYLHSDNRPTQKQLKASVTNYDARLRLILGTSVITVIAIITEVPKNCKTLIYYAIIPFCLIIVTVI